jgi:site-specific recombinase XerC
MNPAPPVTRHFFITHLFSQSIDLYKMPLLLGNAHPPFADVGYEMCDLTFFAI